jgi:probable lipoprotein NlpC
MRLLIPVIILIVGLSSSCKRKNNSSSSRSSEKSKTEKSNKSSSKENKSANSKVETAIKEARAFTGTPYKYGGTTRAGIDCSGLTCQAYKAAGITLPRTANDQGEFGKRVGPNEIQKGDLVFFTDKKGHSKITHVGMVTEVKGQGQVRFIHASTKMGVIEADLFSDYYKGIFLKAVRVF